MGTTRSMTIIGPILRVYGFTESRVKAQEIPPIVFSYRGQQIKMSIFQKTAERLQAPAALAAGAGVGISKRGGMPVLSTKLPDPTRHVYV